MKRDTYLRGMLGNFLFFAFVVLIFIGFLPCAQAQAVKNEPANVAEASKQHLAETYGKLPLAFEANTGQTSEQVKFLSRGQGYTLFLTRNAEAVLVLNASRQKDTSEQPPNAPPARLKPRRESTPPWVVRLRLVNADVDSQAEGLEELPGKANYFIGNDPSKWHKNVPLFTKVVYRNVYRGVDLVYYGNQQQLENDFIVAPGADPHSVVLKFAGVEKLSLDAQGGLILKAKASAIRFGKPRIYQEIDGARREIAGSYILKNVREVGFRVAAYDQSRPLIIDPVLSYSTYLGGSGLDQGNGVAVDAAGNSYVAGFTRSTDFPTTSGAFQTSGPAICQPGPGCIRQAAFVTKLSPAGSALVYSTFLGGTFESAAIGIVVDGAGNAYVTGSTSSHDFPTTLGAFQPVNKSLQGTNAFVTKLNSTGSALLYSTYLGGNDFDIGGAIALDAAGNAYVTGGTNSLDFPVTPTAFQPTYRGTEPSPFLLNNGTANAFLSKLNAQGTVLLYSTFLGGSGNSSYGVGDGGASVALDAQDNAYVAGQTCSSDFPVTPNAFQTRYEGGGLLCMAFVTKVNLAGVGPQSVVYSTYLGGSGGDDGRGIALDGAGNAYVTGATLSTDFPVTPNAFQPTKASSSGEWNAFLTKLNSSGSGLEYSTFLGGTGSDGGNGIALDAASNVYVTGTTKSTDFPTTPDAFQTTKAGDFGQWDAFVTVLNPSGSAPLLYSTYLGGGGGSAGTFETNSSGIRIAVDGSGNAYVTGSTLSPNFPTTPGAFQTTDPASSGLTKAFVAKFSGFPTAP